MLQTTKQPVVLMALYAFYKLFAVYELGFQVFIFSNVFFFSSFLLSCTLHFQVFSTGSPFKHSTLFA